MKFKVAVSFNDGPTPGRSGDPHPVYIEAADEDEARQFVLERLSTNGCAVQVHDVTAIGADQVEAPGPDVMRDVEQAAKAPVLTVPGPKVSAAAERMRRSRERRREGLRCLTVELCDADVEALVRQGLLEDGRRGDNSAVLAALRSHLTATLNTAA